MYQPLLTCTIFKRAPANYRVVHLVIFMVTYDQPVWSEWTNTGLINGKTNYIMPPTLYMGVYKAISKKNDIWVVEQVSVMLIMFVVGVAAVSHDGGLVCTYFLSYIRH